MKPLPDPISESSHLELQWSADEGARQAIERQTRLMGFDSPTDYLLQATMVG
jgi:hypothetical protein